MVPPLAVDIDGTLSRADRSIDPRTLDALREWPGPVVIATGKALPFPVALSQFIGIEARVIAENGGISIVDDELLVHGDRAAADAVVQEYEAAGYDLGWGSLDLANRWRETEIAVSLDSPLDPLTTIAEDHGLEVVDTGFAYHVKSPTVSKGRALVDVADRLDIDPASFLAVGDSENDVGMFETAGVSYAVGNADESAKRAADAVTDGSYADGFLEALENAGR
ncbi:MAG: phosphoglycolate phosphatase [Halobacteriota archaeon]